MEYEESPPHSLACDPVVSRASPSSAPNPKVKKIWIRKFNPLLPPVWPNYPSPPHLPIVCLQDLSHLTPGPNPTSLSFPVGLALSSSLPQPFPFVSVNVFSAS
ncbi:unnamed protein product [Linum trigynum]|uniref:Uncharacterized protein n=1 Tax=Linum trigynum TaxID=586398 RepID=A0AAV2CKW1_9ROSI